MLPEIVPDAVTSTRVYLTDQLKRQGVRVVCRARVVSLEPGKVSYIQDSWSCVLEGIETVVLAIGSIPEKGLADELTRGGYDFQRIGDCLAPKDAMAAIHQGYAAALGLPVKADQ